MKNNENKGCLSCLGRIDDGKHEYDSEHNIWYCPSLIEGDVFGD